MPSLRHLAITATALLAMGCSGEEEPEPEQEPYNICEEGDFETPYDDIKIGLVKTGDNENVKVELMSLSPATPVQNDENQWTVKIMDMGDAPMPTATLTDVEPFMPDHGHGSQELPVVGETSAEGEVDVTNIFFQMPGVWTVTFTVDDGGVTDKATFGVCIKS